MNEELNDFEKKLKEIVNSFIDGNLGKMTDVGAKFYADILLKYYVPSRDNILNVWELGNEWRMLDRQLQQEMTQRQYIQKHWKEGDYYGETRKETI